MTRLEKKNDQSVLAIWIKTNENNSSKLVHIIFRERENNCFTSPVCSVTEYWYVVMGAPYNGMYRVGTIDIPYLYMATTKQNSI